MSKLFLVNTPSYDAFQAKTKYKEPVNPSMEERITTTILTNDPKKPIPLAGLHYEGGELNVCGDRQYDGELKITRKVGDKPEWFIDLIHEAITYNDNEDGALTILAIPTSGMIKSLAVGAFNQSADETESVESKLYKVRMARNASVSTENVKVFKGEEYTDGEWNFDKTLYLVIRTYVPMDKLYFQVRIEADHANRHTDENGQYSVISRSYAYDVYIDTNTGADIPQVNSLITVTFLNKKLADERPVSIKFMDDCEELNPFLPKTDKPKNDRKDFHSDHGNKDYSNKPRYKNNKSKNGDLIIPPAPEDSRNRNNRRRGNGNSRGRHNKYED